MLGVRVRLVPSRGLPDVTKTRIPPSLASGQEPGDRNPGTFTSFRGEERFGSGLQRSPSTAGILGLPAFGRMPAFGRNACEATLNVNCPAMPTSDM